MPLARVNRFQQTSADNIGTATFNTSNFTPADATLLVAIASAIEEADTGFEGGNITLSGGGLTWTPRVATTNSPAWSYGSEIFTAPVTTGASMALAIDESTNRNMHSYRVEVYEYSGYDTTTPVGGIAFGSDADGDGAATITLDATPALTSEVLGACVTGLSSASGTVTQGSDFTELFEAVTASWAVYESQVRAGSVSTTVGWQDVLATGTGFGGSSLIGIEIREAPAVASFPRGKRIFVT